MGNGQAQVSSTSSHAPSSPAGKAGSPHAAPVSSQEKLIEKTAEKEDLCMGAEEDVSTGEEEDAPTVCKVVSCEWKFQVDCLVSIHT